MSGALYKLSALLLVILYIFTIFFSKFFLQFILLCKCILLTIINKIKVYFTRMSIYSCHDYKSKFLKPIHCASLPTGRRVNHSKG